MGNTTSRHDTESTPRSTVGPDGGHVASVTGVYTEHEWDVAATTAFINSRAIAPFYRGLQDDLDVGVTKEEIDALLDKVGKPEEEDDEAKRAALALLPDRRKESERHRRAEVLAYQKYGVAECPICFLYYPANMKCVAVEAALTMGSMARCCDQPICSECFVQIKRIEPTPTHLVSEPVSCPYCQESDFGVIYRPPPPALQRTASGSRAFATPSGGEAGPESPTSPAASAVPPVRRKSMSATDASVVSVDKIHPNWQAQLDAVRATAARRAARRIVFRRVGDRLVPVGVTSARDVAYAAQAAEGGESEQAVGSSGRRSGRRRPTDGASYLQSLGMTGADLEEMMMQEAMRLSLAEEEDRQRRESQASTSAAARTASGPITLSSAPAGQLPSPLAPVPAARPIADVPARTSSATPVAFASTPRADSMLSRPSLSAQESFMSDAASVHSSLNYEPARRGEDDDSSSFISTGESTLPLRPRASSTAGSLSSSIR